MSKQIYSVKKIEKVCSAMLVEEEEMLAYPSLDVDGHKEPSQNNHNNKSLRKQMKKSQSVYSHQCCYCKLKLNLLKTFLFI